MNKSQIKEQLINWVENETGTKNLTSESLLLEQNILPSIDLIGLVLHIEELIGEVIPDEKLEKINFSSVNKIVETFFSNG